MTLCDLGDIPRLAHCSVRVVEYRGAPGSVAAAQAIVCNVHCAEIKDKALRLQTVFGATCRTGAVNGN